MFVKMKYKFETKGVCAKEIIFDIDKNNIIQDVQFLGGCSGNANGIAVLAIGEKADKIIKKLEHISCGGRPTSCPDQLAKALKAVMDNN